MADEKYWEKELDFVKKVTECKDKGVRAVLSGNLGVPVSRVNIETLVAYIKVAGWIPEFWDERFEARFFAACLACRYDIKENGEIPAEKKLHSLYAGDSHTSESLRKEIEALFTMNFDDRAIVPAKLSKLFGIIGDKNLRGINLAKLITDLRYWDYGSAMRGTRGRWARAVIYGNDVQAESPQGTDGKDAG